VPAETAAVLHPRAEVEAAVAGREAAPCNVSFRRACVKLAGLAC